MQMNVKNEFEKRRRKDEKTQRCRFFLTQNMALSSVYSFA